MIKTSIKFAATTLLFVACVITAYTANDPECNKSDMWEFVVNNAYRVADDYATERNTNSVFASSIKEFSFFKQVEGEFKGKYLLMITVKHGNSTSFAVLLPLFDPNKSSANLDDNKPLWRVVSAKLNGKVY